ncbi:MAG: hypothetical protein V3U09_02005 [Thermoplasmata archaeon]
MPGTGTSNGANEEPTKPRRSARKSETWKWLVPFVICTVSLIFWIAFLYVSVSPLHPCSESTGAPVVDLVWPPFGMEIEVSSPSRLEPLEDYKVSVLKNGEPWPGYPKVLIHGDVGVGPEREYLNFTDLTSDGQLSGGDFFTLENLESGSQYEIILLWAANDNELASEVVTVP